MKSSLLYLFLVFSCSVRALDLYPEYQGLSEADLESFDRPIHIDSEYQSLLNAYALPAEWERQWLQANKAVEISVGSLSNKYFLQSQRLKIVSELTPTLNFYFTYFEQRDREMDQVRHILELSQKLTPRLFLHFYGQPSLYKRENDLGAALVWNPLAAWKNRFYYTSHDLTRATHNNQDDYYRGQRNPVSMGWNSDWITESTLAHMGFRYDTPVDWVRPQEQRIFHYEKKLGYFGLQRKYKDQRFLTEWQWDRTVESQNPQTPTSPIGEESWQKERLLGRFSYRKGTNETPVSYEILFTHAERTWTDVRGETLYHANDLPGANIFWRTIRRGKNGGETFDYIQIGYELNAFDMSGNFELTSPEQRHEHLEHRLLTAYQFAFSAESQLYLALNFDLDDMDPVPSFEGGNARFRTDF